MSTGFQRTAHLSYSSSDCACVPRKQNISQTSTWKPWLKNTCSESVWRTDCRVCRWPSLHGLLIFLISVVAFLSSPALTQPFMLAAEWMISCKGFMSISSKRWLRESLTQSDSNCNHINYESNKLCLCDRTAAVITDYLLAWFCKNTDIWWKEDKGISWGN